MADEENGNTNEDNNTLELDSRTVLSTYDPDGTIK